jgi:hypothetical protein
MALTKVKNVLDITADTVVDLASTEHKTGSIQLLGFHTKGDGGGGVFYWDATKAKSEHNGGTVIDPSIAGLVANWEYTQNLYFTPEVIGQGCWVREYSGAVNVKWFGAKGDGVADDTAAIQASIDCIENGDMLFFDSGVYAVSSSITLDRNIGFKIQGTSPTSSSIRVLGGYTNFPVFIFTGLNGPSKEIKDIEIGQLTSGSYNGITGFKVDGCNGLLFTNVWTRGLVKGFDLDGSYICLKNVTAEYCYVGVDHKAGIESIISDFIGYKNEKDILISNSANGMLLSNLNFIATKTVGLDLSDVNGVTVSGVSMKNDGTGYTPDTIRCTTCSNINISNVYSEFGSNGVLLQGAGSYININNVNFTNLNNGVTASTNNYCNISNIVCNNINSVGVYFNTSARCSLNGGKFTSCSTTVKVTASGIAQISNVSSDSDGFVDSGNNTALRLSLVSPDPTLTSSGAVKYN